MTCPGFFVRPIQSRHTTQFANPTRVRGPAEPVRLDNEVGQRETSGRKSCGPLTIKPRISPPGKVTV